jgi:hypothetical protein
MPCYFFSGTKYIRVTRGLEGPGTVDVNYPADISAWGWKEFGSNGIDAALYSGPVDYFFAGDRYIRVTRGETGPGKVDPGYPKPISTWGWKEFGASGINAALWSDTACYFFEGNQYIRVTRGDTGQGTVDDGYPKPISEWGWGEFGKKGIDAALNSGPVDYFFSGNYYIRVTRGDTGPGTVDADYPKLISEWGWKEFGVHGINAALFSGADFGDEASPPELASRSNYFMANGGKNLSGVEITIDITESLVCTANGPPAKDLDSVTGFTWQLNCYSPAPKLDAVQQYVIGFQKGKLYGQINNWVDENTLLVDAYDKLTSVSGDGLPVGYKLRIALHNDSHQNVSGVTFSVLDANGNVAGSKTRTLTDIGDVTSADLSPIVAFEINLVGPGNGESATFSSGAGTIIYQASERLTASATKPSDAESDLITEETANSTYSVLSATAADYFTQKFGVSKTAAPKKPKAGQKFRPPLTPPPLRSLM